MEVEASGRESDRWRKLLAERKAVLLNAERELRSKVIRDLSSQETGEISRAPTHPADLATNAQETETMDSLSRMYIKHIQDIEDAVDRLDKGTFGKCENCGGEISEARLKAVPETRYCFTCESEIEADQIKLPEPVARESLRVSDIMQSEPITIRQDESVNAAAQLLSDNEIRHLPVVDDEGELLGILTDRDLLSVFLKSRAPTPAEETDAVWNEKTAGGIMTKTPETVSPDTDLTEAANLLLENKFSCLPVVDNNLLVGIITESDFVKLAGRTS